MLALAVMLALVAARVTCEQARRQRTSAHHAMPPMVRLPVVLADSRVPRSLRCLLALPAVSLVRRLSPVVVATSAAPALDRRPVCQHEVRQLGRRWAAAQISWAS